MHGAPDYARWDLPTDRQMLTAQWARDAMELLRPGVRDLHGPLYADIVAGRIQRPVEEVPPDVKTVSFALGNLLRRRKGTSRFLEHELMDEATCFFPLHELVIGMRESSRRSFRVGHLTLPRAWAALRASRTSRSRTR